MCTIKVQTSKIVPNGKHGWTRNATEAYPQWAHDSIALMSPPAAAAMAATAQKKKKKNFNDGNM